MDVDEAATKTGSKAATGDEGGEEDYSEVMNDPEFLQVSIMSPIHTYKPIALGYRFTNILILVSLMQKFYLLQSVLESLPGVDPQSEAMRQAMGALTGTAKKDDKDGKKNDDKDKK